MLNDPIAMEQPRRQGWIMTPDSHAHPPDQTPTILSLLGLLAAAPDRSSFFVELRAALPHLLPEVRVDLLAPGFGDEGPIVFTTGGLLPPPDIDTGADLALW